MNKHATSKIIATINKLFVTESSKIKHHNNKVTKIASAVIGLIQANDVKLTTLARFNNKSKTANMTSLEQNSRRMLDNLGISIETYAKALVFDILKLAQLELIIDRTNWQDGTADINYFVLSVIWNNIAIPLYWIMLDNKGGSSDDQQRIAIIKWAVDIFGANMIACVYADREFPSYKFFNFLLLDQRTCSESITLDLDYATQLYAICKATPLKISSAITIANQRLKFLNLTQQLTIIDTGHEFLLAEILANDTIKIQPMIFSNQYKKIKQEYNFLFRKFMLEALALASTFKGFILKNPIKFVVRCKCSTLVSDGDKTISLTTLQKDLHRQHSKTDIAKNIRRAFGHRLYISTKINYKGEFVFIVANHQLENPFQEYKRRWFIETMFAKFKSFGFNLENTHIKHLQRLSSLFLLTSIAYLCCCKIGLFVHSKVKPINMKKLATVDGLDTELRLQYSIFRLGLELLKNFINNHLFSEATMAKLLHKILDSDIDKLKPPKRSKAFVLLGSI